jgi:hypothetical protein
MKAELRISIKQYRKNKNLKITPQPHSIPHPAMVGPHQRATLTCLGSAGVADARVDLAAEDVDQGRGFDCVRVSAGDSQPSASINAAVP